MKPDRLLRTMALIVILLAAGCVRIDVGEKTSSPTLGEQMIDLYKARQAGAVSESEYEETRKKLLNIW